MATQPKNAILIAGVGMALAGIVMLNVIQARVTPKTEEQIAAETREREAEAAKQKPAVTQEASTPVSSAPAGGDTSALAFLGPETTLGSADAPQKIVIGWTWTPEVQADPGRLHAALQTIEKALAGRAALQVVNLDARPDGAPLGVSQNGTVVAPLGEDGFLDGGAAAHALQEALGIPHADHSGGAAP